MFGQKQNPHIGELQQAFRNAARLRDPSLYKALRDVLTNRRWALCKDKAGHHFESFPEWAIAAQPHGLGISCQETAQAFIDLLLAIGDYQACAEFLARIVRPVGRPGTASGEPDHTRFYRVATGARTKERMLLRLWTKHPEYLDRLAKGEFDTLGQAAVTAGVAQARSRNPWHDITEVLKAFRELTKDRQVGFIIDLIKHLDEDARHTLRQELRQRVEQI